ncbi:MAG: response regulator [Rhodobacterales bacterium]
MSKTILTVDDSGSIRQMIKMTLSGAGYSVVEAVDGVDGYAKATSMSLAAIVTDLYMPRLNGIEFFKKYRQHPSSRGVPIIFLTTESDESLKQQARAAGATGWIVKPFKQEQLLAVIKKVANA